MNIQERLAVGMETLYFKQYIDRAEKGMVYKNDPLVEFDRLNFADFVKSANFRIEREEMKWTLTMKVGDEERVTTANLLKGYKSQQPTIVFNQGLGMIGNQPESFLKVFVRGKLSEANIWCVHAQAHENQKVYKEAACDTLLHQQASLAGSVLMTQAINEACRRRSAPVVDMGVSMGGMVSAWTAILYKGSADLYFPLVAYPDATAIFLSDGWWKRTDHILERRRLEAYSGAFVSDPESLRSQKDKIFPVLAEVDPLIPYQAALDYWKKTGVPSIMHFPYGHFLPFFKREAIRKLMLEHMIDMFSGPKRF